ncbi:hypothetical protein [Ruminococcus flavefaciens]|uniref:hypothetical protein n=1 Tax=Ruminococcus flavefaciens TaxID=1265 RepID=UPI0026EAA6B0|nr:hypothetical protein [Ruminococcus flavefaciens]
MIFVILGIAIALACYRMGIMIGRRQEQERFDFMRQEMSLDSSQDAWDKLFKE